MVHTRAKGKSRRVTIGRHGLWTAEDALRAKMLLYDLRADRLASMSFRQRKRSPGQGAAIRICVRVFLTETMRCESTPWHLPAGKHALP